MGIKAVIAENGAQGLEKIQSNPFDLVLMDCQMPVMDSFDATRELRRQEKSSGARHLPVVAVTAYALEGDREKCLAAGMDDYLTKPIQRESLQIVLNRFLAEHIPKEAVIHIETPTPVKTTDNEGIFEQQKCQILEEELGVEMFNEVLDLFIQELPIYLNKIRAGFSCKSPLQKVWQNAM